MIGDHGKLDVEYLQKENRKLRLELKETTEMCQMHRDAVLSLTEKESSSNNTIKALCTIIRSSRQESLQQNLREEIFGLEGQIMVLEKIVNQTS